MPVARSQPLETRVIAHVDLDCFYVQVEQRRRPELRGKPTGVVQYNPWKGGALIAVNYEARNFGVKRSMRGEDARKACPDINLIQVPVAHDKADLKLYRDAGSEVCNILARMGKCERASIDEVYLDITEAATARLIQAPSQSWASGNKEALKSHVVGIPKDGEAALAVGQWLQRSDADQSDQLLACGAVIIAELRTAVLAETQFTCSAGIAHNKMLAKLASGMHKPAQQTIVPFDAVERLLSDLPIDKIGQLGGKLGSSLKVQLGVKTAGDLLRFSETKLQDLFGANTGTWLWRTARGINGDEVKERMLPKSHSSGKTFPGPKALKDLNMVGYWLKEMAEVLQERLDMDAQQNNRTARLLTLHVEGHLRSHGPNNTKKFPSKSCALRYGKERIAGDALRLFEKALQEFCPALNLSPPKMGSLASSSWRVTGLSVSASNIVATPGGIDPISRFFRSSVHAVPDSSADNSSFSPPVSPESNTGTLPSAQGTNSMDHFEGDFQHTEVTGGALCKEQESWEGLFGEHSSLELQKGIGHARTCDRGISFVNDEDSHLSVSRVASNAHNAEGDREQWGIAEGSSIHLLGFPLSKDDKGGNHEDNKSSEGFDWSLLLPGKMASASQQEQGTSTPTQDPKEREVANFVALSCSEKFIEDSVSHKEATDFPIASECFNDQVVDGCTTVLVSIGGGLTHENLSSSTDGQSSEPFLGAPKRSRQLGLAPLMEFWKHKDDKLIPVGLSQNDALKQYEAEEIDESVLAELPAEIQLEVKNFLRMKRHHTLKKSTIGDFFKH